MTDEQSNKGDKSDTVGDLSNQQEPTQPGTPFFDRLEEETQLGDSPLVDPNATEAFASNSPSAQRSSNDEQVFGRYRIRKRLGKGGMGTVFLAYDTALDREVALKMPHLDGGEDSQMLERFYREAKAAAHLNHVNLCPVYDVGEIDGQHFLTMPLVKGKPLTAYISGKKRLPIKQIILLVRKLALAMQVAHEHGVIHRDLKPANILIGENSEPVIVDFGLARRVQHDKQLTQTGVGVGSPSYMSPEQVEGDPSKIGPTCDIYSLGIILYELLVGQVPFQGDLFAVISQIITSDPKPPSQLREDTPPKLDQICLKSIAKNAKNRHASMAELAVSLQALLRRSSEPKAEQPLAPLTNPDGFDPFNENTLQEMPYAEPTVVGANTSSTRTQFPTVRSTPPAATPSSNPSIQSQPEDIRESISQLTRFEFYRKPWTKRRIAVGALVGVGAFRLLALINLLTFLVIERPGLVGWICSLCSLFVGLLVWAVNALGIFIALKRDERWLKALVWGCLTTLILVFVESVSMIAVFTVAPSEAMATSPMYSMIPDMTDSFEELSNDLGEKEDAPRIEIKDPFMGERYRSRLVRLFGWEFIRLVEIGLLIAAIRILWTETRRDKKETPDNAD